MKYFYREGMWIVDKRIQYDKSKLSTGSRQIDKIKKSLPCSVTEAFTIVGLFFENPSKITIDWNSSLKDKKVYEVIQEKSNQDNKDYYSLFFDDDSPIVFRGTKISLFDSEEDLLFVSEIISKKLETLGSNAVVKHFKFKPDN